LALVIVFQSCQHAADGGIAVAGMAVVFPGRIGLALIIAVTANYFRQAGGQPGTVVRRLHAVLAAQSIVATAVPTSLMATIRHEALAKAAKTKGTRRPHYR